MKINEDYLNASNELTKDLIESHAKHIINPENLMAYDKTIFVLDKGSKMNLNGQLILNGNCYKDYERSTILKMGRNAKLVVKSGEFSFYYGGDISIFDDAVLSLKGKSFINSNCLIRCAKRISIGKRCAISHNVTICDSDFHTLAIDGVVKPRLGQKGITIGDHVWIGTGATILKDVTIGEGAVIAAGALVTSDIPPYSLAAGVPAKVIKTDVLWGKEAVNSAADHHEEPAKN